MRGITHHDTGDMRRELLKLQFCDASHGSGAELSHRRVPVRGGHTEQVVQQAPAILHVSVRRSLAVHRPDRL